MRLIILLFFSFFVTNSLIAQQAGKIAKPQEIMTKAQNFIDKKNYDSAIIFLETALAVFENTSNRKAKAEAYMTLGNVFDYKTDSVEARKYYFEAIKIYNELGDKQGAILLKRLVSQYNLKKERSYWIKIDSITRTRIKKDIRNRKDSINLGRGYVNLSRSMHKEKKLDSALYYSLHALSIFNRLKDTMARSAITHNLGIFYRTLKMPDSSIFYFQQSLRLSAEMKDKEAQIHTMLEFAKLYLRMKNYPKSADILRSAQEMADSLRNPTLRRDTYLNLYRLDSTQGNFKKALQWHNFYYQLQDSLISAENSKVVQQLTSQFEGEKNSREIDFLKSEKRFYIALLIVFALLIGSLLYFMIYRTRTGNQLRIQKEELEKQNLKLNETNVTLENAIQEKDGLIGVVAHDLRSPLSKTTGLIKLISLTGPLNNDQREMVSMIGKVCDDGNVLIKDLLDLYALENEANGEELLETIGVDNYLNSLLTHHQSKATEKKINIQLQKNIPQDFKITTNAGHLTRILDNLLSNALKFSNANTTVQLNADVLGSHLQFRIRDEGPGIKESERVQLFKKFKRLSARPTAGESSTGLGLSIVKTLVEKLKGDIEVESIVGKGTIFKVIIPI